VSRECFPPSSSLDEPLCWKISCLHLFFCFQCFLTSNRIFVSKYRYLLNVKFSIVPGWCSYFLQGGPSEWDLLISEQNFLQLLPKLTIYYECLFLFFSGKGWSQGCIRFYQLCLWHIWLHVWPEAVNGMPNNFLLSFCIHTLILFYYLFYANLQLTRLVLLTALSLERSAKSHSSFHGLWVNPL